MAAARSWRPGLRSYLAAIMPQTAREHIMMLGNRVKYFTSSVVDWVVVTLRDLGSNTPRDLKTVRSKKLIVKLKISDTEVAQYGGVVRNNLGDVYQ